jgi:hypothetical protein
VALDRLASGTRREDVAILAKGSWGEGGINTAAAIHKDTAGCLLVFAGVEAGVEGGWQGRAGQTEGYGGVDHATRVTGCLAGPQLQQAELKGAHNSGQVRDMCSGSQHKERALDATETHTLSGQVGG